MNYSSNLFNTRGLDESDEYLDKNRMGFDFATHLPQGGKVPNFGDFDPEWAPMHATSMSFRHKPNDEQMISRQAHKFNDLSAGYELEDLRFDGLPLEETLVTHEIQTPSYLEMLNSIYPDGTLRHTLSTPNKARASTVSGFLERQNQFDEALRTAVASNREDVAANIRAQRAAFIAAQPLELVQAVTLTDIRNSLAEQTRLQIQARGPPAPPLGPAPAVGDAPPDPPVGVDPPEAVAIPDPPVGVVPPAAVAVPGGAGPGQAKRKSISRKSSFASSGTSTVDDDEKTPPPTSDPSTPPLSPTSSDLTAGVKFVLNLSSAPKDMDTQFNEMSRHVDSLSQPEALKLSAQLASVKTKDKPTRRRILRLDLHTFARGLGLKASQDKSGSFRKLVNSLSESGETTLTGIIGKDLDESSMDALVTDLTTVLGGTGENIRKGLLALKRPKKKASKKVRAPK
jgi:hypothetical protein